MLEDVRPFDEVADDLIRDANDKVLWARKQANKLLAKANDIEEMAAITASKYREAAASLVLEAQGFADGVTDILIAEFPMNVDTTDEEDEDE